MQGCHRHVAGKDHRDTQGSNNGKGRAESRDREDYLPCFPEVHRLYQAMDLPGSGVFIRLVPKVGVADDLYQAPYQKGVGLNGRQ